MKVPQFYVSVALGALCVILSITFLLLSKSTQNLQVQIQAQQQEVNQANAIAQHFQSLASDMVQASAKNDKIKQILAQNGITVNAPAAPSTPLFPAK